MNSYNGFVLSYLKYGDYDGILHVFTAEAGYVSFFAKGIFNPKSKKKAFLAPLNELSINIHSNGTKSQMQSVSSMEFAEKFEIEPSVITNSILFFASEFLNQILRNENPSIEIYQEIKRFLAEVNQKNYGAHYLLLFKMLDHLGHLPLNNENIYLNPESGTFEFTKSHWLFDEDISALWKYILENDQPYEMKIPKRLKKNFMDSLLIYYQFHFENFRIPKSLEIVREIFED